MTNVCLSELDGEEGAWSLFWQGCWEMHQHCGQEEGYWGLKKKVEGEDSMLIEMQDAKVLHETGN
jgi:hypothetical protein